MHVIRVATEVAPEVLGVFDASRLPPFSAGVDLHRDRHDLKVLGLDRLVRTRVPFSFVLDHLLVSGPDIRGKQAPHRRELLFKVLGKRLHPDVVVVPRQDHGRPLGRSVVKDRQLLEPATLQWQQPQCRTVQSRSLREPGHRILGLAESGSAKVAELLGICAPEAKLEAPEQRMAVNQGAPACTMFNTAATEMGKTWRWRAPRAKMQNSQYIHCGPTKRAVGQAIATRL